jgi:ferric-dicitrate binding protein FerR (iron transport regulator)
LEEDKLIRFLNGTASPKEEQEVAQWLKEPESRREFDALMEKYIDNPSPRFSDDVDYKQMLGEIHQKIHKPAEKKKGNVRQLIFKSLKVAASVVLITFSAYVMIENYNYKEKAQSDRNQTLITYTTRTTGPGEKLTITMPDKTKVIVNSQSEITFGTDYGKTERVVNIKGEAFFEVAKDPSKPFKVISEGVTTTALGTAFNVYSRNNDLKIALVEGKVAVTNADQKIELTPGLMALMNSGIRDTQDISIQKFDQENLTAWKEGKLIFDRKPFGEILKDLSKWYAVDIKTEKGVNLDKKVIGTFQNKNLEDILTGLGFSLGFEFEIKGKSVHIRKQRI